MVTRYYATFLDESINGLVAKMCSGAHPQTFQRRAHLKFGVLVGGEHCEPLSKSKISKGGLKTNFW